MSSICIVGIFRLSMQFAPLHPCAMCGSRKYPYPHHEGNWKFRRGEGVKDPENSEGEGVV